MDGFRVDAPALTRAADQVRDALPEAPPGPVHVPASGIGHAGLADGLAGFQERWTDGVRTLVADGQEIAARLVRCGEDYGRGEQHISATMSGGGSP